MKCIILNPYLFNLNYCILKLHGGVGSRSTERTWPELNCRHVECTSGLRRHSLLLELSIYISWVFMLPVYQLAALCW